ncbi:protein phosphatase 1 regulatory subunit 12B-like [Onychostoma macrolepis]|uniref:protein phosphatase 1 regulatory subunit 12B-like n=1 Tax=Onychostoma macrolepis TaxID=369639 RepID=UPI0027295D5F|nr:protein phosphatase 1 regulatory subunit 12B-like [Onychostoma macrolepis]
MQDCLLRTRMIPVRDEDAESQRKAKSRQARQTRRATQGVTLSELLEAKRTFSPSKLEMPAGEASRCLQRRVPEDPAETSPSLREEQLSDKHLDEQGNWKRRARSKPERSSFCLSSVKGACGFTPSLKSHSTSIESEWTDENDNILYGSSDVSLKQQLTEDRDLSTELTSPLTQRRAKRAVYSLSSHSFSISPSLQHSKLNTAHKVRETNENKTIRNSLHCKADV